MSDLHEKREPNDDREALVETFLNATKGRQVWSPMHEAEIFADAILAAGFSRAADAVVTEEQVKWQYGLQDSDGFVGFRNLSLKSLRKRAKRTGEMIVRRRPASKWEEVSNDTK